MFTIHQTGQQVVVLPETPRYSTRYWAFQAGLGLLLAAARNELILLSVIAVSRISVSDSANPAIAEAGDLTKR